MACVWWVAGMASACDVRVLKTLSRTACAPNVTFGCHANGDRAGVWVADGCRGRFEVDGVRLRCGTWNVHGARETCSAGRHTCAPFEETCEHADMIGVVPLRRRPTLVAEVQGLPCTGHALPGVKTIGGMWAALDEANRRRLNGTGWQGEGLEGRSSELEIGAWLQAPSRVGLTVEEGLTVCEIGLNAGHSAVAWLCAFPGSHYKSFDLLHKHSSRSTTAFLQQTFPGRFAVYGGDTRETLPRVVLDANRDGWACNVFSIDGGHTLEVAGSDLRHGRELVRPGMHVVVMDDLRCQAHYCEEPTAVWDAAREQETLEEVGRCGVEFLGEWSDTPLAAFPEHGWCFGRYATRVDRGDHRLGGSSRLHGNSARASPVGPQRTDR